MVHSHAIEVINSRIHFYYLLYFSIFGWTVDLGNQLFSVDPVGSEVDHFLVEIAIIKDDIEILV